VTHCSLLMVSNISKELLPASTGETTETVGASEILLSTHNMGGSGSSVGIATDYGLDGPGIESQ
jgi:hypothetical protein